MTKPWKEVFVPRGTDLEEQLAKARSKNEMAEVMMQHDQPACAVIHRFGPGIYIREATYPANTLIIGMDHIHPHTNILLKGSILVSDGESKKAKLTAPFVFIAPPGSKMGYTLEEVVWQNIYSTNETDIQALEAMLFKTTPEFDSHQKELLVKEREKRQVDRDDFERMLIETGWTCAEMDDIAHRRDDCIPFQWGSYSVAQGQSGIQGRGLFATAPIAEGKIIAPMRIDWKRTPAGYLVNHSASPNAIAEKLENGDMYLIAKQDIAGMRGGDKGEEITLDYRQVMKINNLIRGH